MPVFDAVVLFASVDLNLHLLTLFSTTILYAEMNKYPFLNWIAVSLVILLFFSLSMALPAPDIVQFLSVPIVNCKSRQPDSDFRVNPNTVRLLLEIYRAKDLSVSRFISDTSNEVNDVLLS